MKKIILAAMLCIILMTCKKNDDPAPTTSTTPTTLLTFKQESGLRPGTSEFWIFVTDESGNELATRQYTNGETFTLTTTKSVPSKIVVNTFAYSVSSSGFINFDIFTYLAVPVGQSWIYGKQAATQSGPSKVGTAAVSILNTPSNLENFSLTANGQVLQQSLSTASGLLSTQASLFANPTPKAIVSYYSFGQPRILELTNLTPGGFFIFDFQQSKAMDNTIQVSTTGASSFQSIIWASNSSSAREFLLNNGLINNPGTTATVGYMNGYTNYETLAATFMTNGDKTYYKLGSAPSSIPLLNYTLSTSSTDVKNFKFTVSGNYHVRQSYWGKGITNGYIRWMVTSPSTAEQKNLDIPQEIKSKYSSYDFASMPYASSSFYVYLDGSTYESYLGSNVNGVSPASTPKEFQKIAFY